MLSPDINHTISKLFFVPHVVTLNHSTAPFWFKKSSKNFILKKQLDLIFLVEFCSEMKKNPTF